MSMLKGITWHILDFLQSKFEKKKKLKQNANMWSKTLSTYVLINISTIKT